MSLISGSKSEIQKQVDSEFSGNAQRARIEGLSRLLKHIGRNKVKLRKDKKEDTSIKYLTPKELEVVLKHISHDGLRALVKTCFYTGMRLGEALAGEENEYRVDQPTPRVFVEKQLRGPRNSKSLVRTGVKIARPKSRKRWAYVIREGIESVELWRELHEEFDLSHSNATKLLKEATVRAFPRKPRKQGAFNMLRHSYAIQMLQKGVSMGMVSQSLGNTERVCQEYYVGFQLTVDSMSIIHLLMTQKPSLSPSDA